MQDLNKDDESVILTTRFERLAADSLIAFCEGKLPTRQDLEEWLDSKGLKNEWEESAKVHLLKFCKQQLS